jgi:hypothetical protein
MSAAIAKQTEIIEPIKLVFIQTTRCYICDTVKKLPDELNWLLLGYLYGWLYCDDCSSCVRSSAIHFINSNNIPLHWLFGISKFSDPDDSNNKSLTFFRKSKKDVQEAILKTYDLNDYIYGCYMINSIKQEQNDGTKYGIYLFFNDVQTKQRQSRMVSLANIFAHNDGLYEELINCKNIFDNKKIVISFDDLSLDLQNGIHDEYKLSCVKDKCSYNQ